MWEAARQESYALVSRGEEEEDRGCEGAWVARLVLDETRLDPFARSRSRPSELEAASLLSGR